MPASLKGRVAVVTGAASGIGLALARRAACEGMQVVMADVERDSLASAADDVEAAAADVTGADVIAVTADVSVEASVQELAAAAETAFGPPWLVCNNAGVAGGGLSWELSHADWEWVLGVNLWGVINGVRTFVPGMVARNDGYVVNTASMAGLLASPGMGPYCASKHAVVALSETLYRELSLTGAQVGVSVLCPGFISTRIMDSDRNRPSRLGPAPERRAEGIGQLFEQVFRDRVVGGMDPAQVAAAVFDAVVDRRFWILTHADQYGAHVRERFAGAVEGRDPDPFRFE